ncbi:antibiotic biosynthesis monooxygenase family protein [Alkalihalobacillus sp. CinArs1]|uniref:antibiotic biosynthesis monooxygenase family protein n=1 Tax=Alkalihalobacillus sp. CinArs1 TaxID=2995314 RepID=UPI0022DE6641|nr:antibiotic biosynthesis monooxygenase [Alkalihalobacillus sp. CinArs1]
MVIEKAAFIVNEGMEKDFEETFMKAVQYISASPGFISHQLTKSIETESKYVIFVEWDSLAAHTEGFMKSDRFNEFVSLMDPFLKNVEMEHLVPITTD